MTNWKPAEVGEVDYEPIRTVADDKADWSPSPFAESNRRNAQTNREYARTGTSYAAQIAASVPCPRCSQPSKSASTQCYRCDARDAAEKVGK